MKFIDFLNENTINTTGINQSLKKAAINMGIEIFKNNIFITNIDKDIASGFMVYTLNGPNEAYNDGENNEEDYFYIGSFKYNMISNKVTEIKESTVDRFNTPVEAVSFIKKSNDVISTDQ